MAKRTVTRWVSRPDAKVLENPTKGVMAYGTNDYDSTVPVEMTYDDGQPETPKTVNRVVEGFIYNESTDAPFGNFFKKRRESSGDVSATLIIHEPVKEPTLVELLDKYLASFDPSWDTVDRKDLRAALAREKGKR